LFLSHPELFLKLLLGHDRKKFVQGHKFEGMHNVGAQIKKDELDIQLFAFSEDLDQRCYGG
jgi:hypothetical protein